VCSLHHNLDAVLGLPRHRCWQAKCDDQLQDLDMDSGHHNAEHFLLVRLDLPHSHDFHQALHDFFQLGFLQVNQQCLHQEQVVVQVDQQCLHQDQDFVQVHQLAMHHQLEYNLDLRPACQHDFDHLDRDH